MAPTLEHLDREVVDRTAAVTRLHWARTEDTADWLVALLGLVQLIITADLVDDATPGP